MTLQDVLFTCLGVICAGAAILAVTTRQIVHSALWLTACLSALSGCYLVLGAELVALVQMLVYVGAVVVLVLFAIMLTRAPIGRSGDHDVPMLGRMVALVVSAATGGLMLAAFAAAFGSQKAHLQASSTRTLAVNLFGRFTWPFEALSLVLLTALVGALAMMGLQERDENAVGSVLQAVKKTSRATSSGKKSNRSKEPKPKKSKGSQPKDEQQEGKAPKNSEPSDGTTSEGKKGEVKP